MIKQEVSEKDGETMQEPSGPIKLICIYLETGDDNKQFLFENENKAEIKKESPQDNMSNVTFNRNDSGISKLSETPSNTLKLSFNNEEKKDKTLLKKFINMKNEPKI